MKEICHCGHDIATHHHKKYNCLAMMCECKYYQDHLVPKRPAMYSISGKAPEPRKSPPHADISCKCKACYEWAHEWSIV